KARVGELPVVGWIDRLHHQADVEIELELDGADEGESVRAGVPWPQGAGPANAEVIGVHVGARNIFVTMRIEGGVSSLEQRGPCHRAARVEGHVESTAPPRSRQNRYGNRRQHRKAVRQV